MAHHSHPAHPLAHPSWLTVLRRGLMLRCPRCGQGRVFHSYTKVRDCDCCGQPLAHLRADDAPPYLTILVVSHVVLPLALVLDALAPLPIERAMIFWAVIAVLVGGLILPRAKGLVLAYLWRVGVTGDETYRPADDGWSP